MAQSYKYDIKRQTLTVFNHLRQDTTITFNLTSAEKEKIVSKYFKLNLDEIDGNQRIDDKCMIMPKLYTTLRVKSEIGVQELIIDEDCNDYNLKFVIRGRRISAFLEFVRKMLHAKPEIKNAPKSDIFYI